MKLELQTTLRKRFGGIFRWVVLPRSLEHLQQIREEELQTAIKLLPPRGRLLELGAGTGWQARWLAEHGFEVTAIEVVPQIEASMPAIYRKHRIYPIIDYDGYHLPFGNRTFDIVFSSSVLEHIPHDRAFQKEIHLVLKENGKALHIMPSATWRFYSTLTYFIRRLPQVRAGGVGRPLPHGEKGSLITEHYHFSRIAWKKFFRQTGWEIERIVPNRLFYTGECIRDKALSCRARRILSYFLGSACHLYLLSRRAVLSDAGSDERSEIEITNHNAAA